MNPIFLIFEAHKVQVSQVFVNNIFIFSLKVSQNPNNPNKSFT